MGSGKEGGIEEDGMGESMFLTCTCACACECGRGLLSDISGGFFSHVFCFFGELEGRGDKKCLIFRERQVREAV